MQDIGIGAGLVGLGLLQLRLGRFGVRRIKRIVDLRQHRPFLHHRAVVDLLAVLVFAEGVDQAADLRADIDEFFRFDRAGGADGGFEVAPFDGRRPQLRG